MCDCPEAQEWRSYWTDDAVGQRLREELSVKYWAYRESIRKTCNDLRGPARMSNDPPPDRPPPFAELERRRAIPGGVIWERLNP